MVDAGPPSMPFRDFNTARRGCRAGACARAVPGARHDGDATTVPPVSYVTANRRQVETDRALFPPWPGSSLRHSHISAPVRQINAMAGAADIPHPSWPGASGPSVAAPVAEIKG